MRIAGLVALCAMTQVRASVWDDVVGKISDMGKEVIVDTVKDIVKGKSKDVTKEKNVI